MDQGIDYGEGTEQKGWGRVRVRVRSRCIGLRIAEQGQKMAVKMEQLRIE